MTAFAPCLYEVSIEVDAELADEYRSWLCEHARQMLALPGFIDAQLWEVERQAEAARIGLVACYTLRDRAALEAYLAGPAQQMRAAGRARFGERFTATRRILGPLRQSHGAALSTSPPGSESAPQELRRRPETGSGRSRK